jgi:nucleoid-associated protein EbfC
MTDMNKLFEQLQGMQEQLARVQSELGNVTAKAEAGGGMVQVTANGRGEITAVKIEKEVIDPAEQEMLEDLVVAAVNRAIQLAKEAGEARVAENARSMFPPGMMPPGFTA